MDQNSSPPPTEEQRQRFVESLHALHRTGKGLFGEMPVYPLLVYMAAIAAGPQDLALLIKVMKEYVIHTCEKKGITA